MSFSSIWSKILHYVNFGVIAAEAAGAAGAKIPGASYLGTITELLGAVGAAEAAFTASGSGSQKLAAAKPQIVAILQTSELFQGGVLKDPQEFSDGVDALIGGLVKVLNSYGK